RRLVHGRQDRDRPDDHPCDAAHRHQQGVRPDALGRKHQERGGLLKSCAVWFWFRNSLHPRRESAEGISEPKPHWVHMLANVPLIPKFASEVTAMVCELRNRDTSRRASSPARRRRRRPPCQRAPVAIAATLTSDTPSAQ